MSARLRPVLRYPGAKADLAPWVIRHFPPHEVYVEPFFGSGAVLLAKPRSRSELVNDLDGRIVTFFRVLRDRPEELAVALELTPYARDEAASARAIAEGDGDELERARAFAVNCWQTRGGVTKRDGGFRLDPKGSAHTSIANTWARLPDRVRAAAERLRGVAVENKDAIEVVRQWHDPDALIYADPPYLGRERQDGAPLEQRRLYDLEMSEAAHLELLEALDDHPGPVVLSGYDSTLYADRLSLWSLVTKRDRNDANGHRAEALWLNPYAARQTMLFHPEA
jgi:DNA adenine methylase